MQKTVTDKLDCAMQIKISTELVKQLEEIAQQNHIPRAALIRLVLAEYVNRKGNKTLRLSDDK